MPDETPTPQPGLATEGEHRVLDASALKALAHPLRVHIYDILSQGGAQTASSLAAMLGESSGSTSYHLRALARHDLIRAVEGKGTGREKWWERPRGSVSMTNPETVKSPSGLAVTQVVVGEFYRRRDEELREYFRRAMVGGDWAALLQTCTLRLTPEQFQEVSDRLQSVLDEVQATYRDQDDPAARRYSTRLDLFPLEPRSEDAIPKEQD